jgi:hypothetical protein
MPGEERMPVVHRPMDPWPVINAPTLGREAPAARPARPSARITIEDWRCAFVSCHASAGSVRLDDDIATIRGYAARTPRGDCVQVIVAVADKPRLLKALRTETGQELFEIDERFAPSYCSPCRKAYCPEHWTAETSYPPGLYHKCPSDHIRSLYSD